MFGWDLWIKNLANQIPAVACMFSDNVVLHVLKTSTKLPNWEFVRHCEASIIQHEQMENEYFSTILRFDLMAKYQLKHSDIVFLRGAQEEMFSKLLQLQLAPNPIEILEWMFEHGVNKTIESYGFSENEIKSLASSGTINISKWTSSLNKSIQDNPGHTEYFLNLKHAAYSHTKKILFVNRGVDISRPLSAQNDCFWWGYQNFSQIDKPYFSFKRIVRGYQSNTFNDIENAKTRISVSYTHLTLPTILLV